jgi:hypothetical protein
MRRRRGLWGVVEAVGERHSARPFNIIKGDFAIRTLQCLEVSKLDIAGSDTAKALPISVR